MLLLQALIDQWQARKPFAFAETFEAFTLTPGTITYQIGPGLSAPDFAVTVRPARLEQDGAALILNNQTPPVDQPMNVRNADWWNNQRVKTLTTNVPTDVYYEQTFPNGRLHFWPVPDYAYGVRLRLWSMLSQITSFNQQFIAPPAYLSAVVFTLAQWLCMTYHMVEPPYLRDAAVAARLAAQINSPTKSPRISSADSGTRGQQKMGDFNYFTGGPA